MSYELWGGQLLPAWLQGPWGQLWTKCFGGIEDALKNAVKDAVKARFVALAPDDALPYIGDERRIRQGRLESLNAYRDRLKDAWNLHQLGGTALGVEAALVVLPIDPDATYAIGQLDPWHFDNSEWWSRYWLLFEGSHGFTRPTWGSGIVWGTTDSTWGFANLTAGDVQELRRIAWSRQWKSAHSIPVVAVVVFTGVRWGTRQEWGSGVLWGNASDASHIRLGDYWGLHEHNYGDGPYASAPGWGDADQRWGAKPEGVI